MDAGDFEAACGLWPEAILLLSRDDDVVAANAAAAELLQAPCPALRAASIHALVTEPRDKVSAYLRLCRRARSLVPGTLTFRLAADRTLSCRAEGGAANRTGEASGSVLLRFTPKDVATSRFAALNERIDALNREILHRQRAESMLHAQHEWLRTTLSSIGDGVIATDASGAVVFLNPVAEKLTGWVEREAKGLPLDKIFNLTREDSRETVGTPLARVLNEGVVVNVVSHTALISRDGTERPISESGAPIRGEDGTIIGVVLVFHDETERRISEKRLASAVEYAPVPIMIHADDGEILNLSRDWIELSGYSRAALPTVTDWARLAFPDRVTEMAGLIQQTFELTQPVRQGWELSVTTRTGRTLTWLFSTASLGNLADGRRLRITTAVDLTERKATENALRRANAALEQFAYAAAHDLQEPIRNVSLYTQLLVNRYQGKFDGKADEILCRIVDGAGRMQDLIRDLLAYTQATEEDAATTEPISCMDVMQIVLNNLQSAIDAAQACVRFDGLPFVPVYPAHIISLFQNLVANSLKYRSAKPVDIEVSSEVDAESSSWIFTVRDNGIGIPPEYHQRIFRVFKRLHGSGVPGTGIGLAICKRIVSHYGGRIWVESAEGQGAAFRFTLPMKRHHE